MNVGWHALKKKSRKIILSIIVVGLFYLVSYFLNSLFGGYWLIAESDGRDRYSFGLSMPTAILWQPLFGHEAIGHWDHLGAFYTPLIRLDRKFIHRTIYISDDDGYEKAARLSVSKVHPNWRDTFVTKVAVVASRDESGHAIRCTFQLTGPDRPRAITEIRIPRELAQTLDATPPEGFSEKSFEDSSRYFNKTYLRWVGNFALPKDQDVMLAIPAKQPKAGVGRIVFYYQRSNDTSRYSLGYCSVSLDKLATE